MANAYIRRQHPDFWYSSTLLAEAPFVNRMTVLLAQGPVVQAQLSFCPWKELLLMGTAAPKVWMLPIMSFECMGNVKCVNPSITLPRAVQLAAAPYWLCCQWQTSIFICIRFIKTKSLVCWAWISDLNLETLLWCLPIVVLFVYMTNVSVHKPQRLF